MKTEIADLVRENIRNLVPYSSAREEYTNSGGILLDANENPFGEFNRYPDPYQRELKQRISELKGVNTDQVFVANGSDEIIDLALRIFCEPGKDKVLTFTPTYGMYQVAARINNVEVIEVPLNGDFQIDLNRCTALLADSRLKLIFICSPNNPTGNLLRPGDVEHILRRFKGIVIIDEAYIDFSGQDSFCARLNEFSNLIVLQTLSKAWGLANLRIGIACMKKEILTYFNKVKPPYNVSGLNQQTALYALNQQQVYAQRLLTIQKEKEKMIEALQSLAIVKKIYPSDANFLLIEVADANEVYKSIADKNIIVRNRDAVIRNCLRITIGTEAENRQLLTALKETDNG